MIEKILFLIEDMERSLKAANTILCYKLIKIFEWKKEYL